MARTTIRLIWLAAAIAEKVGHVHEIVEQQQRRVARRAARTENIE